MNQRTSNTLFLGCVVAGAAVVALLAPAANATEPVMAAPVMETRTVCTDDLCIAAPLAPVVALDAVDDALLLNAGFTRFATTPDHAFTNDIPTLNGPTFLPDITTVIGRLEQDSSSAADPLLGTNPAFMPDHIGDLDTVDSVTGLGLVSTF